MSSEVKATENGSSDSGAFIFGQNLSSRVTSDVAASNTTPTFGGFGGLGPNSSPSAFSFSSGFGKLAEFSSSSGTSTSAEAPSGFLFAQALLQVQKENPKKDSIERSPKENSSAEDNNKEKKNDDGDGENDVSDWEGERGDGESKSHPNLTLSESAKLEYDAKQVKPVLEEVDLITGEEDERNVFEMNVKLHVFDKDSQQWKERGRAAARLNDAEDSSYSRLVLRMAGTLRVIINTKMWSGMSVKKLSEKNVSFSALDAAEDNLPRVFLISCSPHDAELFYCEVSHRVELAKSEEKSLHGPQPDTNPPPSETADKTESSTDSLPKTLVEKPQNKTPPSSPRASDKISSPADTDPKISPERLRDTTSSSPEAPRSTGKTSPRTDPDVKTSVEGPLERQDSAPDPELIQPTKKLKIQEQ